MSITRISKFEAKDGMGDKLHAFLASVISLVEQSPGCESCRVLRSQENSNEFLVVEQWISVAAHQASVKNIPPEKIGAVMPMLARPPSGSYYAA
jgi:heme oxygenase (mycobilin-producing)